jgi:hypothetical protein
MRELLAERAPRSVVAVTAFATVVIGGAAIARQHPCPYAIAAAVAAAPAAARDHRGWQTSTGSMTADLDGDTIPEVVTMTFAEQAGQLITRVGVERLRGGALIPVGGAAMELSAPLDPPPCIGTAIVWRAGELGGGRIELTDYHRVPGPTVASGERLAVCAEGATRVFRLRGGELVETPAFSSVYY